MLLLIVLVGGDVAAASRIDSAALPAGKIAFAEENTEVGWIGVVTLNGQYFGFAAPKGYSEAAEPAWSPDASKIAFVVIYGPDYSGSDVWIMDANGHGQRRLARNAGEPAWSSDGDSIAFIRRGGIWVMKADGTGQRLLIRNGSSPAWSPDSRSIAFARGRARTLNSFDIYVANADGTHEIRLTKTRADEGDPDWSPDGTKIAYDRLTERKDPNAEVYSHIFVMNADGNRQHRITKSDGYDPSWSPSGAKLVYGEGTSTFLFTINSDGTGAHKIYPPPTGPGVCDCNGPAWSRQ
jgi:Tol biopolymer transport system component